MADKNPPFCGVETKLECPKCGEQSVYARESESYFDGVGVDGYCTACWAKLHVNVSVDVYFDDVELAEYEDEEGGAG